MSATKSLTFAQRIHFPTAMTLGILGVVLFVIGDGIEAVWITDFFHGELGFTVSQSSLVYTSYGIVVAVAAFLSGALCDAISPRKVMLIGLISFLLFDFLFITVAIPSKSLPLLMLIYGLRGFGYPMLAYGFLTWMMIVTAPERQSSASGWFWFAFSLGMQTIGSYLSSLFVPSLGGVATLWIGLALAALGGWVTMYFLRSQPSARASKHISVVDSLFSGLSITWRRPKVGAMGIVKIINLAGQYGMQAFYLVYVQRVHHMESGKAILEFTIFGIVAIAGDVLWGIVGDKLGWHRTLQWIATPLSAASLVYLYLIPNVAGPNFWLIALGMAAIGIGLSAHVPTTPLIMAHAGSEKASSSAILNLGAGLGAFVGPAVVTLLVDSAGYGAVAYALAGLYVMSFVILLGLKLPEGEMSRQKNSENSETVLNK